MIPFDRRARLIHARLIHARSRCLSPAEGKTQGANEYQRGKRDLCSRKDARVNHPTNKQPTSLLLSSLLGQRENLIGYPVN